MLTRRCYRMCCCRTPEEVHATLKVYNHLYGDGKGRKGRAPGEGLGAEAAQEARLEQAVHSVFERSHTKNWTWAVGREM